MFEFQDDLSANARIKIVGVGGGGCNAIRSMMTHPLRGVDFVAINTDAQILAKHEASSRIQIGAKLTRGMGSGANPEIGRNAALEDSQTLRDALFGADMIFIVAGMGGGTGTGAAPVIAKLAQDMGILTIGLVTKPFSFEGRKRYRQAEQGLAVLKDCVDTLICVPNDNILSMVDKSTPIVDSFKIVDQILLQTIKSVTDLISVPGLINLDFADISAVMKRAGLGVIGSGCARGENRAVLAAEQALRSPLLVGFDLKKANGILINICGSSSMTLFEINEACRMIQDQAHEDVNVIFGSVIDDKAGADIRVTMIATGLPFVLQMQNAVSPQISQSAVVSENRAKTLAPWGQPATASPARSHESFSSVSATLAGQSTHKSENDLSLKEIASLNSEESHSDLNSPAFDLSATESPKGLHKEVIATLQKRFDVSAPEGRVATTIASENLYKPTPLPKSAENWAKIEENDISQITLDDIYDEVKEDVAQAQDTGFALWDRMEQSLQNQNESPSDLSQDKESLSAFSAYGEDDEHLNPESAILPQAKIPMGSHMGHNRQQLQEPQPHAENQFAKKAITRQYKETSKLPKASQPNVWSEFDDDKYDIPAFIRRRAD